MNVKNINSSLIKHSIQIFIFKKKISKKLTALEIIDKLLFFKCFSNNDDLFIVDVNA